VSARCGHDGGQLAAGLPQRRPGQVGSRRHSIALGTTPLYQGVSARIRENGGSTPTRPCGRVGSSRFWRRRSPENYSRFSSHQSLDTRAAIHRYKVEPYVVCADVYSSPQHGRPRRLDLVHGVSRWMYRTQSRGFWASTCGADSDHQSLHSTRLVALRSPINMARRDTASPVANPRGVSAG